MIAACFAVQIALADPDWGAVIAGFAPTSEIVLDDRMLYLALGIIGATVMPHNLYLHSGIVQTRAFGQRPGEQARGAAARHLGLDHRADVRADHQRLDPDPRRGDLPRHRADRRGRDRQGARRCSRRCSAPTLAPILFGVALLCCGLNSTVTATMAGQIVMEGFIRHPPRSPGCGASSRGSSPSCRPSA